MEKADDFIKGQMVTHKLTGELVLVVDHIPTSIGIFIKCRLSNYSEKEFYPWELCLPASNK